MEQRMEMEQTDLQSLGIHLRYISSEVHSIEQKVDTLSNLVGSLMQNLPVSYASKAGVEQLAARVDELERERDRRDGAQPTVIKLQQDIVEVKTFVERLRGGYSWLWVAWGLMFSVITLFITATKGKLW